MHVELTGIITMANRKRKKPRSSRTSPTTSTADGSGMSSPSPVARCGTCAQEVDDRCIGCDKCEVWVHGTEMCSGLPQNVIDAILEYSGEGIN